MEEGKGGERAGFCFEVALSFFFPLPPSELSPTPQQQQRERERESILPLHIIIFFFFYAAAALAPSSFFCFSSSSLSSGDGADPVVSVSSPILPLSTHRGAPYRSTFSRSSAALAGPAVNRSSLPSAPRNSAKEGRARTPRALASCLLASKSSFTRTRSSGRSRARVKTFWEMPRQAWHHSETSFFFLCALE